MRRRKECQELVVALERASKVHLVWRKVVWRGTFSQDSLEVRLGAWARSFTKSHVAPDAVGSFYLCYSHAVLCSAVHVARFVCLYIWCATV